MSDDHVRRARDEPVEVVDYDPAWPSMFEAEAARLRTLLGDRITGRVEHFGSTAVPGLVAKPIVDVLVEVPDLDAVPHDIAPVLRAEGYEFFWRPVSPGDAALDYAWFIRRDEHGRRTHHVHMLPPGSPYWDRLVFRDLLRADRVFATAYADVKRRAAASHGADRTAYAAAKGRFIRRALATAGARG